MIKIVQIYTYSIYFEPKYSYAPVRVQSTHIQWVKIGIGHGISILTITNQFFHVSRAVTIQNGWFRICEARVGQNRPGLHLLYTFWTRYIGRPCQITRDVPQNDSKMGSYQKMTLKWVTYPIVHVQTERFMYIYSTLHTLNLSIRIPMSDYSYSVSQNPVNITEYRFWQY